MRRALPLIAITALAATAVPALAVHESHHGPFVGTTTQDQRFVMRTVTHTRLGIRFRWRGDCEHGSVLRIARIRNVPVNPADGRFFKRTRSGIGVRGKIGFDPLGNPVPPEPFKFSNNEARGRFRANVVVPDHGMCRSGLVKWEARR